MNIKKYLKSRRETIEASLAVEMLAGNSVKVSNERTALAEITAMEDFVRAAKSGNSNSTPCTFCIGPNVEHKNYCHQCGRLWPKH